jgi:hypothetical protein
MKINLYQIFYDDQSKRSIDPGFIPLDNSKNKRQDWFEFWPIKKFLTEEALNDNTWYGFFSPRFTGKTGFDAKSVKDYITQHGRNADVALFTSTWDFIAYFQNVFEQGEVWHEGITEVSQRFFDAINYDVSLSGMVHHTQNAVTANYLVAKPRFWRRWKDLAEKLFAVSESEDELGQIMRGDTTYGPRQIAFKVFIQERLAPVILASESFQTCVPDQTQKGMIFENLFFTDLQTRKQLQACDLLKLKYCQTRDPEFLYVYKKIKARIPIKPTRFR